MAKSNAKKFREKMEREGRRNPESSRSIFASVECYKQMTSKISKTKKDKLYRNKFKNRIEHSNYDGSFYFA